MKRHIYFNYQKHMATALNRQPSSEERKASGVSLEVSVDEPVGVPAGSFTSTVPLRPKHPRNRTACTLIMKRPVGRSRQSSRSQVQSVRDWNSQDHLAANGEHTATTSCYLNVEVGSQHGDPLDATFNLLS